MVKLNPEEENMAWWQSLPSTGSCPEVQEVWELRVAGGEVNRDSDSEVPWEPHWWKHCDPEPTEQGSCCGAQVSCAGAELRAGRHIGSALIQELVCQDEAVQ